MKHHAHKILAFAAVALLLSSASFAQEKKIEVQNMKDSYSIIREAKNGWWLVSNYYSGQNVFTRVHDTSTIASQLWLGYIQGTDSLRVNDFEIFRDTVYFCGQVWRQRESNAVWGYFPLNNFPNVDVRYWEAESDRFTRLDIFSIDTMTIDLHVAMIADNSSIGQFINRGVIYDEVRLAPDVFNQYTSTMEGLPITDVLYYDIAVTDTNVAVSSTYSCGNVMFFCKPTTVAMTFFDIAVMSYPVTFSNGANSIMLEYCENNALVAFYKNIIIGPSSSNNLQVRSFVNAIPHARLEICNSERVTPYDVKYDKNSKDLDVLAAFIVQQFNSIPDRVYHLNPSLLYNGGPIFAHVFPGEVLNSLEWFPGGLNTFVASGHDNNSNFLRIYKYKFDNWNNCFEQMIEETKKQDEAVDPEYIAMKYDKVEIEMLKMSKDDMCRPIKIICD